MNQNLDRIAFKILDIDFQIAQLQEQRDTLTARLLTTLEPGTKTTAGDHTITISQPRRTLNTRTLTHEYPPTTHPNLYKLTLDTQKVRKALSEDELAAGGHYTYSKPAVSIK